jgi:hypothetical protein
MDKDLDLNKGGALRDGSAAANSGGYGANAADFARGYQKLDQDPIPTFAEDADGGTTTTGDPLKRGGFAGRPLGWAR